MEKQMLVTTAFISALLFSVVVGTELVDLGTANPYLWAKEGEVPPPLDAQYPIILILSPKNTSYTSKDISFAYNVSFPKIYPQWVRIYYKTSWNQTNTLVKLSTIDFTGIPEGYHYLEVTAFCEYVIQKHQENYTISYVTTETASSCIVYFTIDLAPQLSILSLENETYNTSNVTFDFAVNEPVSAIIYSLDGKENMIIAGNLTLTGLSNGYHNVAVYATDEAGNVGASQTVYFSVDVPFPTTMVIAPLASVAVVGAGLLVYFKKRKR